MLCQLTERDNYSIQMLLNSADTMHSGSISVQQRTHSFLVSFRVFGVLIVSQVSDTNTVKLISQNMTKWSKHGALELNHDDEWTDNDKIIIQTLLHWPVGNCGYFARFWKSFTEFHTPVNTRWPHIYGGQISARQMPDTCRGTLCCYIFYVGSKEWLLAS